MKLLLIAIVICIHTSEFLTTAEVKCRPFYDGGYGLPGVVNVIPGWSFNPPTNRCEQIMTKGFCRRKRNCFLTVEDCEDFCDPAMQEWKP
uniref:Putative salivary kunitz domain protein n=1 Tax=Ixodes ricinus TaxID=34613 RepID=A0A0K8RFR5_IXORI